MADILARRVGRVAFEGLCTEDEDDDGRRERKEERRVAAEELSPLGFGVMVSSARCIGSGNEGITWIDCVLDELRNIRWGEGLDG